MENQNRDFKGIWIPKDIYLSKELNWTDKLILIEIDSLDNENHCTASNAYFAEFVGISERNVSKSINKLIQLGYIKLLSFNGKHRALTVESTQTRFKRLGSIDSNVYHNNIDNNICNNNTSNKKEIYKEKFEEWWSFFPKQRAGSKQKAYLKYKKAIMEDNITPEFLLEKVKEYANSREVAEGFACGGERYFNDCKYNNLYATSDSRIKEESGWHVEGSNW